MGYFIRFFLSKSRKISSFCGFLSQKNTRYNEKAVSLAKYIVIMYAHG